MKRTIIIGTYFVVVAGGLIAIMPEIHNHTNRIPMIVFFGTMFSLGYWVVATILLGKTRSK